MDVEKSLKEKIQHLGWTGTPSPGSLKGRQRSNSVAVGSPGSFNLIQHQLEDVSRQLEDKEKDVQLAAEIGKILLEKNNDLESQVTHLTEFEKKYFENLAQLDFYKKQNETINVHLKDATMLNEFLESKIKENETELWKFVNQGKSKSGKKGSVNVDLLKQELEELKAKDLAKEKSLIKLKCENELHEDIKELNEKLHSNSKLNAKLELDSLSNVNRMEELQQKLMDSTLEIESLRGSYAHLQEEKEKEIQKLQELANEHAKEMERMRLDHISEIKLISEKECDSCASALAESRRLAGQIETLVAQMEQLRAKECESCIKHSETIQGLSDQLEQAISGESGHLERIKSLSEQLEALKVKECDSCSSHITSCQDLERQLKKLKGDIASGQEKEINHLATIQDLGNQIESLKSKECKSCAKHSDIIHELSDQLEHARSGESSHLERIKSLLEQLEALKVRECDSCTKHSETIHELSDQLDQARSSESGHLDRIKRLSNQLEELRSNESSHLEKIQSLLDQMVVIESKHSETIQDLSGQLEQARSNESSHLERIKSLMEQFEHLGSKECESCANHITTRQSMENQLDELRKDQLEQLRIENIAIKERECKGCKDLEDVSKILLGQLDELRSQLKTMDDCYKDQLEEIRAKECTQCVGKTREVGDLNQQLDSLRKQHVEELERTKDCPLCSQHLNKLEESKIELDNLKSEVDGLTRDQEAKRLRIEELEKEIERLKDMLDSSKVALQTEVEALKIDLQKVEESRSQYAKQEEEFIRHQQEQQKEIEKEQVELKFLELIKYTNNLLNINIPSSSFLFDLDSGIVLSQDGPIEPDSPEIGPSSEEKAAKLWLKTVDIAAASLDDFQDENCNYAVKIGRELRFSLVGIAGKDFVDGNKKFLLSFVWQMMRYSVLKKVNLKGKNGKDITEADL
eukprot:gene15410-18277_t